MNQHHLVQLLHHQLSKWHKQFQYDDRKKTILKDMSVGHTSSYIISFCHKSLQTSPLLTDSRGSQTTVQKPEETICTVTKAFADQLEDMLRVHLVVEYRDKCLHCKLLSKPDLNFDETFTTETLLRQVHNLPFHNSTT